MLGNGSYRPKGATTLQGSDGLTRNRRRAAATGLRASPAEGRTGAARPFSKLLACAIVMMAFSAMLRAIIPSGYMPEMRADGFSLVICGPSGLETRLVDEGGRPIDDEVDPKSRSEACAFSGGNVVRTADAPVLPARHEEWGQTPKLVAAIPRQTTCGPPRAPPSSTGPPLLMI